MTGGLALAGLRPQPANSGPGQPRQIAGVIAGHIRLDPIKGATIRLAELNENRQTVRNLAFLEIPGSSLYPGGRPVAGSAQLRQVCREANDLAVRVAAAAWQVAPEMCVLSGHRIVHLPSGRFDGYSAWVDMV